MIGGFEIIEVEPGYEVEHDDETLEVNTGKGVQLDRTLYLTHADAALIRDKLKGEKNE